MTKSITKAVRRPDRKRGMTLAELGAAVQQAHRADLPPESTVRVDMGWRGQLQKVTITSPDGVDD